jgi:YebC/PmpR family DNA-binding regulatory protein
MHKLTLVVRRGLAITGRASKNVANKKNKQDAAKSKLYTRLGVRILMAAKNGLGADPGSNPELAKALKEATNSKLPKENIERSLKKATEKSAESWQSGVYEVLGYGGAGIIVQTLTDNPNRAVKAIKSLCSKADVKFTTGGSVLFSFALKGVIRPIASFSQDKVLELALDNDVDDIDFAPGAEDGEEAIILEQEYLSLLTDALASAGIEASAELEYVPISLVEGLSEEDVEKNEKLVADLEGFLSPEELRTGQLAQLLQQLHAIPALQTARKDWETMFS